MASSKISALGSGAPVQAADLHVVARGSSNYKLTTAQVFSETLTRSAFETKRTASGLVAGRSYRVTGCGTSTNLTVIATATDTNQRAQRVAWISTAGPVEADWLDLQQNPAAVYDGAGNTYHNYLSIGGTKPTLNDWQHFTNCRFSAVDALTLDGVDNCDLRESTFRDGNYFLEGYRIENSQLVASTIPTVTTTQVVLANSELVKSTLESTIYENVNLNNLKLNNAILTVSGGDPVNLTNCYFQNVIVEITNGATVDGLTIIGSTDEVRPSYLIDGAYQTQVLNNWAGVVLAELHGGSSTVRANVATNTTNQPLTLNGSTKFLYLLSRSPIGVYTLANTAGGVQDIDAIDTATSTDNWWHVRKLVSRDGELRVTTTTDAGLTTPDRVVKYHNASTKLGELKNLADYVTLSAYYSPPLGDYAWAIVDGHHYD